MCSQSSGFRGFLHCFQESSPSLHILGMRNGVPLGTLVTWPVPDKLLPPFREHLLLAGHGPHKPSGPSRSRAHGHTAMCPSPGCPQCVYCCWQDRPLWSQGKAPAMPQHPLRPVFFSADLTYGPEFILEYIRLVQLKIHPVLTFQLVTDTAYPVCFFNRTEHL